MEGYKLYRAAGSGTIAPAEDNWDASTWEVTAPTLPSGVSYDNTSSDFATDDIAFYESETKADQAFLIIKGKYKDVTGYYKVAFYGTDSTDGKPFINLLRNHAYTVKISYVNTYGWKTEKEAVDDPYPENRMRVTVKDDNPLVTDMIACKDYHLGVSDQVSAAWNESTTATLVTTIEDGSWEVKSKDKDWIGEISISATIDIPDAAGSKSTPGKKYRLSISLTENRYSEETREGHVVVRSGDLTRTITITQKGNDFKRSDTRKVILLDKSDNRHISDDYFIISQTRQKVSNRKTTIWNRKNDGLHFTVVSNRYRYWIPKKEEMRLVPKGPSTVTDILSKKSPITERTIGKWICNKKITTSTFGRRFHHLLHHQ